MVWLAVAIGGAAGAVTRFGLQSSFQAWAPGFPWGTATANWLGCFLVGVIYSCLPDMPGPYKALVMTGFLGALTTLSSFSLEVVVQMQEGKLMLALLHWAGGALIGLLLCYLGLKLGYRC